ncbi:FeoB-associated Cys-rich membrane protein [Desulfovibrio psychrotolerans]|uniref:FeoB-associated Cys-rich membrane protein n=1 Tax=Desulfovibrio psychrotolerans TaxID=415242 RepID=A0A7J0BR76_9BACT|nr:FeoB-associated Cys-rich membrane protein [Desulfovibrio psychrotolerans]GFM36158.1 hypothetical protein DSM19430T_08420 [Desulfovibrio psychrotolerans]
MWDTLAVILIVAVAAIYLVRRFVRRDGSGGCGCGGSGCCGSGGQLKGGQSKDGGLKRFDGDSGKARETSSASCGCGGKGGCH